MTTTPRLAMTYIAAGTSAELPHNTGLNVVDMLVGGRVLSRIVAAPPAAASGDCYIIPTGATGVWSTRVGQVAGYFSGQWQYVAPKMGMIFWVQDEGVFVRYVASWLGGTGEPLFCAARITSNVTIAAAASWTALTWNSQIKYDADGVFTHSTSSNTDQIVLDEAGEYEVESECTFVASGSAGATRVDMKLTIATVDVATSFGSCYVDSANMLRGQVCIGTIITAAAGDVLRVEAQKSGSGTVNLVFNFARVRVRKIT